MKVFPGRPLDNHKNIEERHSFHNYGAGELQKRLLTSTQLSCSIDVGGPHGSRSSTGKSRERTLHCNPRVPWTPGSRVLRRNKSPATKVVPRSRSARTAGRRNLRTARQLKEGHFR